MINDWLLMEDPTPSVKIQAAKNLREQAKQLPDNKWSLRGMLLKTARRLRLDAYQQVRRQQ